MKLRRAVSWWLAGLLAAGGPVASAGIYDHPKNLKVLPADIDSQELRRTMRGFAFDLGVNCESCHVGESGKPLDTFDFAADNKAMKATARLMLEMVSDINGRQLARLDRSPDERVAVGCATCHRGQAKPLLIGDALALAYRKGGAREAVAQYRALKAGFFGSDSFDFTEQARLEFARSLAANDDVGGAIDFLEEVRGEYAATFMTDLTLSDLHLAAGDRRQAIAAMEAAQAAAPPALKEILERRLDGLKAGAAPGM